MHKIIIIFLILIINLAFANQIAKPCFAQKETQKAVEFCQKGDKIVDPVSRKEEIC